MELWLIMDPESYIGASSVWNGLIRSFLVIGCWVAWKVEKGDQVHLDEVPWVGTTNNCILSLNL